MAKKLLAGYNENKPEDRELKRSLESEGHEVETYNEDYGTGADFRDIGVAASGVEEIVNMSRDVPSNSRFHDRICREAGRHGATVSRRYK